MLLAGLGGLALYGGAGWAVRAYQQENFSSARSTWELLNVQKVIEPWRAPFGSGTAALASGDYQRAQLELGRSYQRTPELPAALVDQPESAEHPRCMVTHNLALAYEGVADLYVTYAEAEVAQAPLAEEPASHIDNAIAWYERAIEDYETAISIRTQDGCFDDPPARQREEEKRDAAQEALDELRDPPEPEPEEPEQGDSDEPPPPDSENPDDEDDTGESNTDEDNPNDDPENEQDEPGPDSDDESDQQGDSEQPLTPQEQQRREELHERQRQAQEQAERERAQSGRQPAPQRRW